MPTMVTPWAQKCLIDCATNEGLVNDRFDLWAHSGDSKHIVKGVVVVLQPKTVHCLDVRYRLKGLFKAVRIRTIDNPVRCWIDGPCVWCKSSSEPIIPASIPIVWIFWIMNEIIVVNKLLGIWRKPSRLLVQALLGFKRVKHSSIDVEDLFQVMVHFRVCKESLPVVVVQQSKEHDGEGNSDDILVLKLGRGSGNCIDISHHLFNSVAGEGDIWIICLGQSVQTSLNTHPDNWVSLNSLLEFTYLSKQGVLARNTSLRNVFDVLSILSSGRGLN